MTLSHADPVSLSSSEHQLQLRRAVIASTIGTAIEWYDFFLYSTVTATAAMADYTGKDISGEYRTS